METKVCPSCGTEVPQVANRCKVCFHDFTPPPPRGGGPVAVLGALALAVVIAIGTISYLTNVPTDRRILVDQETQTIQWITQYSGNRLQTDRVRFGDIARLEHVASSGGDYQIVAVTLDGERKVIESDRSNSLALKAQKYARIMDKPLENKDETFGFMKKD